MDKAKPKGSIQFYLDSTDRLWLHEIKELEENEKKKEMEDLLKKIPPELLQVPNSNEKEVKDGKLKV